MKNLRSLQIFEYLQEKKHCSMNRLMERFHISAATLHRDIRELVKQNLVCKVHGGVMLVEKNKTGKEIPAQNSHFSLRINKNTEKKNAVASTALDFLVEGDIVFLDSSTTVLHLARKMQSLPFSHLTIITNSVLIIQEFHLFPQCFSLLSLGGIYHYQLHSFLGKSAIANIRRLKVNKVFFSAFGMTGNDVTTYHESHADFLAETLDLASERFLLLDSTKFGREGLFRICAAEKIDCLVSDSDPPADISRMPNKTIISQPG